MKINQTKKYSRYRLLVMVSIAILLALLGYTSYAYLERLWPFSPATHSVTADGKISSKSTNDVDYSGLSQDEADHSQDAKKKSGGNSIDTSQQTTPGGGKNNVGVAISYADINSDQLEIRAFATGVIEGSGKCTATITKPGSTLTAQSVAFIDASTTICEPMYVAKSQLPAGTWTITVAFDSPDTSGKSSSVVVEVK